MKYLFEFRSGITTFVCCIPHLVQWPFLKRGLEIGVTPTGLRTNYNLFFIEEKYIRNKKIMVVVAENMFFTFFQHFFRPYPIVHFRVSDLGVGVMIPQS